MLSPEPHFKIYPTTRPREFMGEVYVGTECVMRRLVIATDDQKALERMQSLYQLKRPS